VTFERSQTRCAIYTRKSSEEGLDQSFNSLHAQREACEAYVLSQKHEGWQVIATEYDDGGFSGGNMERPGLKKLLADIAARKVDTVVVYKVDRLTRSLADFAKIVESFDSQNVSFVSVTQQFNTTTSMGRLTLNVLLSFAQFEREVTGERIRDKVAASKKKGMWMGGYVPLGYDLDNRQLAVNPEEADAVRMIFSLYIDTKNVTTLYERLKDSGIRSKRWTSSTGRQFGGAVLSRGTLYHLLNSPIYIGKIIHKDVLHDGQHEAIIDIETWNQVAALLKENRVTRRNRHNLPSGRMLYGKLMSPDGQTFTPTHASKKGRRYLYYTLTKTSSETSTDRIRRLPAPEVEAKVIACVSSLLEESLRLADHFSGLNVREMRMLTSAARHRSAVLSEPDSVEGRQFIKTILARVVVLPTELHIDLSKSALSKELLGKATVHIEQDGLIELREPLQVARRGSEVRLILENGEQQTQDSIPSLVRAVTQARAWTEWIIDGKVRTMRELASKAGLNRHYASRILRMAALSPQLVDAILKGKHSPVLTLVGVTDDLPLDWVQQSLSK
jgi:site-specific DNA recombinase